MTDKPVVYLIDDEDQTAAAADLSKHGIDAAYLYPTAVTERHLLDANLLAVDEVMDLRRETRNEDWDLPAGLPPAVVPPDGLALAAVLRSASAAQVGRKLGPLGITMRTSKLNELARGVPRAVRQPLVAAQYDLEWALTKVDEDGVNPVRQLVSLAMALHAYPPPSEWEANGPQATGLKWVAIPDQPWSEAARRHLLACRPPTNTTTTNRHHLAWLRWLAHRALPYPTFAISDIYAATTLGVTLDSFRSAASSPSSIFGMQIASATYSGPLADLQSTRFWRAGIRHIAARAVEDEIDIDDPLEVGTALASKHGDLEALDVEEPVVAIDDQYYPKETPVERSKAERLAPDGWPAYADPAWVSQTEASDPAMERLLAPRLR